MFEITGTIKQVFEEQTFGSGFKKREFVLTTDTERFPQDLKFECVKERVELVSTLKPGDRAKVFFDIRGREWQGRYFVDLSAWKIEPQDGDGGHGGGAPADEPDDGPF
jgi:hypothetical protein